MTRAGKMGWEVLRGVGQIMLQRHAGTGVLFLTGLAANSPPAALAALLGSAGGTIGGRLLRAPKTEIRDGLYGFNAALVALATLHFVPTEFSIMGGMVGVAAATVLMRGGLMIGLPAYTAPFVVVTWILFAVCDAYGVPVSAVARPLFLGGEPILLDGVPQGFGQVMFQANMITEIFFALGLLISSWRALAWGAGGAAAALLAGVAFQWSHEALTLGVYGFNAVLAGIALSQRFPGWVAPLCGIVLAVFLMRGMLLLQLPTLTAPFVLAAWIVLGGSWGLAAWRGKRGESP